MTFFLRYFFRKGQLIARMHRASWIYFYQQYWNANSRFLNLTLNKTQILIWQNTNEMSIVPIFINDLSPHCTLNTNLLLILIGPVILMDLWDPDSLWDSGINELREEPRTLEWFFKYFWTLLYKVNLFRKISFVFDIPWKVNEQSVRRSQKMHPCSNTNNPFL